MNKESILSNKFVKEMESIKLELQKEEPVKNDFIELNIDDEMVENAIYWLEKVNESQITNGPNHEITKEYMNNLIKSLPQDTHMSFEQYTKRYSLVDRYGAAVYIDKNDYTEQTYDYDK